MRVNVYNEEFPSEVALTEPRLDKEARTYIGVRFYLRDPQKLNELLDLRENKEAITFWLRDTLDNTEVSNQDKFVTLLYRAAKLLQDRQREQRYSLTLTDKKRTP